MCSTVRPAGGGPPSITVGAFIMLQLYIGHPSVGSIEAALQRFAEPEHLDAYKARAVHRYLFCSTARVILERDLKAVCERRLRFPWICCGT